MQLYYSNEMKQTVMECIGNFGRKKMSAKSNLFRRNAPYTLNYILFQVLKTTYGGNPVKLRFNISRVAG